MQLLVIGASGLVGTNLVQTATDTGHDVIGTYRTEETEAATVHLDKTDPDAVAEVVREHDPDAIVDTAAYHAVDDCEDHRDRAWSVNAAGTRNVAAAADDEGAHYVYLSTDYVFAGEHDAAPYRETDPVAPCNYYARTKYAGEQAARIATTWTVLRPSVIYGLASGNFATWALGELAERNEIGIVDDQISRPTYAPDLAQACIEVIEHEVTGLYHATGPESLSRYEFTLALAEAYGYETDLVSPISTEDLGQEAPRPADSSLASDELYEELTVEFRSPREAGAVMANADREP